LAISSSANAVTLQVQSSSDFHRVAKRKKVIYILNLRGITTIYPFLGAKCDGAVVVVVV